MALTPKYCFGKRLELLKNRLEDAREAFKSIYENIPEPKEDIEIIRHFAALRKIRMLLKKSDRCVNFYTIRSSS